MARAFIASVPLGIVLVAALVVPLSVIPGTIAFQAWPTSTERPVAHHTVRVETPREPVVVAARPQPAKRVPTGIHRAPVKATSPQSAPSSTSRQVAFDTPQQGGAPVANIVKDPASTHGHATETPGKTPPAANTDTPQQQPTPQTPSSEPETPASTPSPDTVATTDNPGVARDDAPASPAPAPPAPVHIVVEAQPDVVEPEADVEVHVDVPDDGDGDGDGNNGNGRGHGHGNNGLHLGLHIGRGHRDDD